MIRIRSLIAYSRLRPKTNFNFHSSEDFSVLPLITSSKMISQYHSGDPNTLSNYREFVTINTTANFSIDFSKRNLNGNVLLKLKAFNKSESRKIVLDTSYLEILEVKADGEPSKWNLLPRSEPYGSALEIDLAKPIGPSQTVEVDVS